jgi:hypothetical protein
VKEKPIEVNIGGLTELPEYGENNGVNIGGHFISANDLLRLIGHPFGWLKWVDKTDLEIIDHWCGMCDLASEHRRRESDLSEEIVRELDRRREMFKAALKRQG